MLSRFTGVLLIAVGVLVVGSAVMVPIPSFDQLERRDGMLVEASRERFTPCRRGDCTRTMVTVRHVDGTRRYHLADADTTLLEAGKPITIWTHPEFRGFDRRRAWHVVQGGWVIRDHATLATVDRRIRAGLLLLAPVLFVVGGWITRHYDPSTRTAVRP